MIKPIKEIDVKAAKELIRRMPVKDKIKLLRDLQEETWAKRLEEILENIDRRRKKIKISRKEINEEIEKARQEFHAQSRH